MGFTAFLGFVVVGYLASLDQAFGLVNLPRQSTTNIPAQCASLCNPVQVQIDNVSELDKCLALPINSDGICIREGVHLQHAAPVVLITDISTACSVWVTVST